MAIHGGAGARPGTDYGEVLAHMRAIIDAGRCSLAEGATAVDVVTAAVEALESSGLYIVGRGSSPNRAGEFELDAALVDGAHGRAGAVGSLQGLRSPIHAARVVMERSAHAMLVGRGARDFAIAQGLGTIDSDAAWYRPAATFEYNSVPPTVLAGTVGCVARDGSGGLAAATSTGGVFGKMPGRVGDAGIIGAGTWADSRVAVSCTGQGEYFIRAVAAAQIAHRVRFGSQALASAAAAVLAEIVQHGGSGGLIAVDADANVVMHVASSGMKRAALFADGSVLAPAP